MIQPNTEMPIGPRVKTLIATITQTGTNDPTVTIYRNSYNGNITFTRLNVGDYKVTSELNEFTTLTITNTGDGNSAMLIPLSYDSTGYYQISPQSPGELRVWTFADTAFTPKELSDIGGSILIQITTYN